VPEVVGNGRTRQRGGCARELGSRGGPTPHNLDLRHSGLREAVETTWCRGRRCRGRWHRR
jgi:hypothetical protein